MYIANNGGKMDVRRWNVFVAAIQFMALLAGSGCSLLMPRVKTEVDRTDVTEQHDRPRIAAIGDAHVTITAFADGWKIVATPDVKCETEVVGKVHRARGVVEETPGWAYALPVADVVVGLGAIAVGGYFAYLLAPDGDSVGPQAWSALVAAPVASGLALGGLAGFQTWRASRPIEKVNNVDEGEKVVQRRDMSCDGVGRLRMAVVFNNGGRETPFSASGTSFVLTPEQARTVLGRSAAVDVTVTITEDDQDRVRPVWELKKSQQYSGKLSAADSLSFVAWQSGERERIGREQREEEAAQVAARATRDAKQKVDDDARYVVLVNSCKDVGTQFQTWCTTNEARLSTEECDRSGRLFLERAKPASPEERAAMNDVAQHGEKATTQHKRTFKNLRPELWCALSFQAKDYASMYTQLAAQERVERDRRRQRARESASEYFGQQKAQDARASSCPYGDADTANQAIGREFIACVQQIDTNALNDEVRSCMAAASSQNEKALCIERGQSTSKGTESACKRQCLSTSRACGIAQSLIWADCKRP